MHPDIHSLSRVRVGVVGAGRLGTALAAALREAGHDVHGPLGRGEPPSRCRAVVLCVPDAEIPEAATALGGAAPLIGHTSGATSLTALESAGGERFGLHPLQSFPPGAGADAFQGVACAVAGSTPEALALATALAEAIGMKPFEIRDEGRAAYHAAACMASNFLVTLLAAAERVGAGAGLEAGELRALLAPLVRGTVENVAELGPERALTGPVARGDTPTVERQRQAVAEAAPELLVLFDELVGRTEELASMRGAPA